MDLTFDNLGEAADLERGLWPAERRLGEHPSVLVALPRLLDELGALGLTATFCVEAINAGHYPDAVRVIGAHGHEIAMHGWRHERWQDLDADREAELLARGRAAYDALGIDVRGFRPPGGALTPRGDAPLREAGFEWTSCATTGADGSAVAGGASVAGGGDALPDRAYAWPAVDAYHRLDSFAALRVAHGDPEPALAPDAGADRLLHEAPNPPARLILHPFLMTDDAGWAAARRVLAGVAADA